MVWCATSEASVYRMIEAPLTLQDLNPSAKGEYSDTVRRGTGDTYSPGVRRRRTQQGSETHTVLTLPIAVGHRHACCS